MGRGGERIAAVIARTGCVAREEELTALERACADGCLDEVAEHLAEMTASERRGAERAVKLLVEARIDDYADRWGKEFDELLVEVGLDRFSDITGTDPRADFIREDACRVAEYTLGQSIGKGHKMTKSYLSERISEGYKWALYRYMEMLPPTRKKFLAHLLLGPRAEEVKAKLQGPLPERMDAAFWHRLRQSWLQVRRDQRPADVPAIAAEIFTSE